uniref:Uncharacterized protein n=1 Tax=Anopheles atroparvus TaxID=41427 RepID=A0A182J1X3_ANOAO
MGSWGNTMERALLVAFNLVIFAALAQSGDSKTVSRVCFATPADFTNNTSIGLCSQGILLTYKVGAQGNLAYPTSVLNTQAKILSWLPTFCNKKQQYPYVQLYLGVVALGTEVNVASMLTTASLRTKFIQALVASVKTYPNCIGIYLDFDKLSTAQATSYSEFMAEFYTAGTGAGLKLASGLPWEADVQADVLFNPTLPKLDFNVLKTYEDMYIAESSLTHPLSPLFAMDPPFDDNKLTIFYNLFRWVIKGFSPSNIILGMPMYARVFTVSGVTTFGGEGSALSTNAAYCDALIIASNNPVVTVNAGASFTYTSTTFVTFESSATMTQKLNFAQANNLGGVALFTLNTGGVNAELLRSVTKVLAPTPPTGFSYPVATTPTCRTNIDFPTLVLSPDLTTPVPSTTTTLSPTTAAAGATTAAGGATTAAGGATTAAGGATTAAGGATTAAGGATTAAGAATTAAGGATTAAGGATTAAGGATTAAGGATTAAGGATTAAGGATTAAGGATTAAGGATTAAGGATTAAGGATTTAGGATTAAGGATTAAGGATTAAGGATTAAGGATTAAGGATTAAGGATTAAGGA